MEIRHLTKGDYEAYLPLINEFRPTVFSRAQFESVLDYIGQVGEIWIGTLGDQIVATATILYERKLIFNISTVAHIEDVCVSESQRKKGFGKQLIHHLFEMARSKDCYKVTLDCVDSNVPFYTSCGLQRRGNQMCELIANLHP